MKAFQKSDFEALKKIIKNNKKVNFKTLDLDSSITSLNTEEGEASKEILATFQSFLRIDASVPQATNLLKTGFHSVLQITDLPQDSFVELHLNKTFKKDKNQAIVVYQKAQGVKNEILLQYLDLLQNAEPHINAGFFNNGSNIPSSEIQQQIVKLLEKNNGCSCQHCSSVLSPAAYFMGLKDLVKKHNLESSIDQYKLSKRRTDLEKLQKPENLTCENTLNQVPYLNIANGVMETKVGDDNKPYETLAKAKYPFNLPFSLYLNKNNRYLEKLGTGMVPLYKTFSKDVKNEITAREYLRLSSKEIEVITTSQGEGLNRFYGFEDGIDNWITLLLDVPTFLHRTQLTLAELESLLYQNLHKEEIALGFAHQFFINSNSNALTGSYIGIHDNRIGLISPNSPGIPEYITIEHLDCINRFVRLAKRIDWTFAELDLVLRSSCNNNLNADAIPIIATIKYLKDTTNTPLDILCSIWGNISILGVGNTPVFEYEDLFNSTFNNHLAQSFKTYLLPNEDEKTKELYEQLYNVLTPVNVETSTRLLGAFQIKQEDLNLILTKILPIEKEKTSFTQKFQELILIHRYVKMADLLGLNIEELMLLFDVLKAETFSGNYNPFSVFIDFDLEAEKINPHKILQDKKLNLKSILWLVQFLIQIKDSLKTQQLSVYELAYVCLGPNQKTHSLLSKDQLTGLYQNLHRRFQSVLLTPGSLESPTINKTKAKELFTKLHEANLITKSGIVHLNTSRAIYHHTAWDETSTPNFLLPIEKQGSTIFNGSNAYVNCGEGIDLREKNFTIEFWAKVSLDAKSGRHFFVGQGEKASSTNTELMIYFTPKNSNNKFNLVFDFGNNGISIGFDHNYTWHHYAMVYDNTKDDGKHKEIYIDGERMPIEETNIGIYSGTGELHIGKVSYANEHYFDGHLSEVRIWDHARKENLIKFLMKTRLRGNEDGLMNYWPLSLANIHTKLSEISIRQKEVFFKGFSEGFNQSEDTIEQLVAFSHRRISGTEGVFHNILPAEGPKVFKESPYKEAASFNGTNSYINCGKGIDLRENNFTIEFWAKVSPNAKSGQQFFVGQGKKASSTNTELMIYFTPKNSNNNFNLVFDFGNNGISIGFDHNYTWHHYAMVYDKTKAGGKHKEIYIDGERMPIEETNIGVYLGTGELHIGKVSYANEHYFDGHLSEVRIWDHARTPSTIKRLMNHRLQGNEDGLMAYWLMDRTSAIQLVMDPILATKEINHAIGGEWFKRFFAHLQRQAFLVKHFQLSQEAIATIAKQPEKWFGIRDIKNWTLFNVKTLHDLSRLIATFHYSKIDLLDYFGTPNEGAPSKLAAITHWDKDQVTALFTHFFEKEELTHIQQILRLEKVFALAQKLGKNPNKIIKNIWEELWPLKGERKKEKISQAIYSLVKAKVGEAAWPMLKEELDRATNLQKRNVLTGYVIHKLQEQKLPIESARDLYEYLLIDIEMGAETQTTLIKNAIATYQLYINRCRMHLEEGVSINNSEDLEGTWKWMQHYRLWEANQKVFLYPENYLQPELRKDKSYLFKTLEESLNQGEITDENVEKAYKKYMDELAIVANLKICGNYLYPEPSTENKILVLVGRTNTDPLRYYYRKATFIFDAEKSTTGVNWEPWQEIKVTIHAPHDGGQSVYPVYAFGKLFVFWVEISEDKHHHDKYWDGIGEPGEEHKLPPIYKAIIKFTYHDASHNWTQAQTLQEIPLGKMEGTPAAEEDWWRQLHLVYNSKEQAESDQHLYILYKPFDEVYETKFYKHTYRLNATFDIVPYYRGIMPTLWSWQNLPTVATKAVLTDLYSKNQIFPIANQPDWFLFEAKKGSFLIKPNNKKGVISSVLEVVPFREEVLQLTSSGFIQSTEEVDLKQKSFTIEFWVKTDKLKDGQNYIISQGVKGENKALIIRLDKSGGTINLLFGFFNNGRRSYEFPAKKWVHVACVVTLSTKNQSNKAIYINGDKKDRPEKGKSYEGEGKINIGNKNWDEANAHMFSGYLSEIRIWNKALDSTVIKPNMYKRLSGKEEGLIEYWPLDGNLDNIKRSSNHGNIKDKIQWSNGIFPTFSTPKNNYSSIYTTNPGFDIIRLNSNATPILTHKLLVGGIPSLLRLASQRIKETPAFGSGDNEIKYEQAYTRKVPHSNHLGFDDADGIYFWELFFHAPFMLASHLNNGQQFKEARKWYEYIFNPTEKNRPWRFLPLSPITHLTHHNTEWVTEPNQPFSGRNNSLKFNGTNSFIDCGSNIDLRNTDFTIEFWLKPDINNDRRNYILSQGIAQENHGLIIRIDKSDKSTFLFDFYNNGVRSKNVPENNKWVHCALVYKKEGNKKDIYINSVHQIDTSRDPQQAYNGSGTFHIGKVSWEESLTQFLKGNLTEVRIWTKALDGKQIFKRMNRSLNPMELRDTNLLRYWPLDKEQQVNPLGKSSNYQNKAAKTINLLRDPFDPDRAAQLRPVVYRKSIAMHYIDNLLDQGDALFREYTRESINEAVMYYILGYDLLGKRPVSKTNKQNALITNGISKVNANSKLKASDDAAENENKEPTDLLFSLENKVTSTAMLASNTSHPNASMLNAIRQNFCIPENTHFVSYWDKVEDRLYKIRHGLNLEGIKQDLPLFQPAIDPTALLRANLSNGSSTGISTLHVTVPHYRFTVLLGKAKEFAGQVSQLGSALLSALEKKDAEVLSLLRQGHEKHILELTRGMKESQLKEAGENLLSTKASLENAQLREQHYHDLLVQNLSVLEGMQIGLLKTAHIFSFLAGNLKVGASIAQFIPQFQVKAGAPFTIGVTTSFGGQQAGTILNTISGALDLEASQFSFGANLSAILAGHERRAQDWELQENLAIGDVKQIKAQIKAAEWREDIAKKDLEMLEKNIQQNEEVTNFLEQKFTNKELYQWMIGKLSGLYFQAFQMAHDLALSAEKALQYELVDNEQFITSIHWDSLKKGLLSGEALQLDLNRMEKAYLEKNKRRLEVEKTISLGQLKPMAIMKLRLKGTCSFQLTEEMFNRDFPGHYCRQIKSISLSFPAIVGPYQNLNATLTQELNRTLIVADIEGVRYLNKGEGEIRPSIRFNWKSSEQIALSRGLNDSGLFQLNFQDERYLPFEGTGVVSNWKLELSKYGNHFDFNTLTDVIIKVDYTALQGGEVFKQDVIKELNEMPIMEGRLFNINQEFKEEWKEFLQEPVESLSFTTTASMFKKLEHPKLKKIFLLLELTEAGRKVLGSAEMNFSIGDQKVENIKFENGQAEIPFVSEGFQDKSWSLTVINPNDNWNEEHITNIGIAAAYEGKMK